MNGDVQPGKGEDNVSGMNSTGFLANEASSIGLLCRNLHRPSFPNQISIMSATKNSKREMTNK